MDHNNNRDEYLIDYKIVYSRRRSIGISVGPDSGVTVHAPYRTSVRSIEKLVEAKSDWIRKHLENFKSSVRINNIELSGDDNSVFFRGRKHQIRLTVSEKYFVRMTDETIEIGLKNISEKSIASGMLEKWFRKMAEEIFREKFSLILFRYKNYNFTPSEFIIRSLKRRWGSCTSKGKITISSELVKLDDIYLEYVILHELCHLKHHNHGKEFYKLLSEVFPDWKQVRSEIKKYIR